MISQATLSALHQLREATPHLDVYALAGSRNARRRAAIFSTLVGRKVTTREAGITALRAAFWEALGVEGDTIDMREKIFVHRAMRAVQ